MKASADEQIKEIGELSTRITFSLDEINVLGSQQNVAMALQQFSQVDLLLYEKREKEVPTSLCRGS
jgi:hypothetical protein